jgi:hypothetical protein
MFDHRAVPRFDWLSFTLPGAPWADFEWLPELVFFGVFKSGGLFALWALKVLLLLGSARLVWKRMARRGLPFHQAAAGLALWSACLIARSDIRVELFSILAFTALLSEVDAGRVPFGSYWACAAFFALWANLHAGFAAGLLLLCLYSAERKFLWAALAGLAGTLLNPYGLGIHRAVLRHGEEIAILGRLIMEWKGLGLGRSPHWPAIFLLGASGASFLLAWRRGRLQAGPWLAAAAFGLLCIRHVRFIPYFAAVAAPLAAPFFAPALCSALIAACASLGIYWGARQGLPRAVWHDAYAPVRAARFLAGEGVLAASRVYHPWGWGGYLGFQVPGLRVFQDGRYIFHTLFAEAARASESPESWAAFLDKHRIDAALVENLPNRVRTTRLYPDGSRRDFSRPFYAVYFPREAWALLDFDEKALVFARRGAFPPGYISTREYRWLRPGDDEALGDALARGEADPRGLERERRRRWGGSGAE